MPVKLPLISVIIPTYKRKKYLRQVLKDLADQTEKQFEVIVASQGEGKITLPIGVKGSVYYLKKPSITKAKNLAISKARAEVILVLDDDLRLPKDLIAGHLARHKRGWNLAAGPALEKKQFVIKRGGKSFGKFSVFGELNTDYRTVVNPTAVTAVPGGNLSFKKDCWEAADGYDENFKGNSINEDSDFCLRLTKECGKILFDPKLLVTHLRAGGGSRAFGSTVSAAWYEDLFYNHLYFYLKHWPKYLLPFFFAYRMRQVFTCIVKYGKFRLAYLKAPLRGYMRAYRQSR